MQQLDEHITLIEPGDHRVMPWKNGGGSTREIAASMTDDGAFNWRLSIADVESDGEFSLFPGVARTIMLLSGNGMRLRTNNESPVSLDQPFVPFDFDGDAKTFCTLIDGAVRDFNVMSRQSTTRHEANVIRAHSFHAAATPATTRVVHCLRGSLWCEIEGMRSVGMDAGDTLLLEQSSRAFRWTGQANNVALNVDFFRTP